MKFQQAADIGECLLCGAVYPAQYTLLIVVLQAPPYTQALPNGHGKNAAPDDSPLPNPLDGTTSHLTRLQETAAKSLVIPQAGERANNAA